MRRFSLRRFLSVAGVFALVAGLVAMPSVAVAEQPEPPSGVTEADINGDQTPEPGQVEEEAPAETDDVSGDDAPIEVSEQQAPPVDRQISGQTGVESQSFIGTVLRLSDDSFEAAGSVQTLRFDNFGLLSIDLRDVSSLDLSQPVEVSLLAPEGVEFSGDADADFALLAAAQEAGVVLQAESAQNVAAVRMAARGNVSPGVTAEHKVYTVLTSPSNGPGSAGQTDSDVSDAISYVNDYWKRQSGGKISFTQVASVGFAKDTGYNCTSAGTGFAALANRQAARVGYTFKPNTHLVMVFPPSTDCDGAIGLGSVAWSINQGGISWNVGAVSNTSKSTIAHELGHNLTLGHSNYLNCGVASPVFSSQIYNPSGCTEYSYGDVIDVMGTGQQSSGGKLAGALSAAHAIRSGMWTAGTHYAVAGQGTSTHTLVSLSGYAGKRALVATDNYGNDFYVEFRDYTGDDAGFDPVNTTGAVMVGTPGVRILRLENGYGQKGFAGDATQLVSRYVGGVKRADFKAGEKFTNGGLTIAVSSISGGKAVVKVTRAKRAVATGSLDMIIATQYDSETRVGDTAQISLGTGWIADSYSYQWQRSNRSGNSCSTSFTNISGATSQSYVFKAADYSKCVRVKVTGKISGQKSKAATSRVYEGPTLYGIIDTAGTVSIDYLNRTNLRANVGGWANSTPPLKYQWFRNNVAIKGATASTYAPVAADRGKNLHVRVIFDSARYTVIGDGTTVAASAAGIYTISADGPALITGTVRVGETLNVAVAGYKQGDTAITPTLSYQWYRAGKAIKGATKANYTLVAADHAKQITAKITAKYHGLLAIANTSAKTKKVSTGQIAGSRAVPAVTKAVAPGRTLTAALPAGSVTTSGVKVTWQWYVNGAAIKKATKTTYTPPASYYGKTITVRATLTKSKFATVKLTSVANSSRDSIIQTVWDRGINGNLKVGAPLTLSDRTYTLNGVAVPHTDASVVEKFQWMRDGKVISGATLSTYTPVAADIGKKLTVKITFSASGYLGSNKTSLGTPKVGADAFSPDLLLETQRVALPLTTTVTGGKVVVTAPAAGTDAEQDGVSDAGAKRSYQWYRAGVAIKGATKANYTPVSADSGKALNVRISITKSGVSEVVRVSISRNFSVKAAKPTISGTAKVGRTLTAKTTVGSVQDVETGAWSSDDVSITSYQWLRSGKAIKGATGSSYKLKAADKGKQITVKVVQRHASNGYVASAMTSAKTAKVK